jgi:hypothetical protein
MNISLNCELKKDDVQKQRLDQLNHAIEAGLLQLRSGQKIPAAESYQRLKQKIKNADESHKTPQ